MLALNQVTGELNAILIKELRQELRVRGFIWSFIGFHIAMIILTLSSFSAPALPHKWTTILSTTLFWMMLAIPLFISVLVRALTAFRKETTAKELELIFLTSISSWQLVFYKWLALCLQGILLLTAALPYVTVRDKKSNLLWWRYAKPSTNALRSGDYTVDHTTMLTHVLKLHFGWHLARIKCLSCVIVASFQVKTVNFVELATAFSGSAKVASHYRRIQPFFKEIQLQQDAIARFVVSLLPYDQFVLSMDRTNWMLGCFAINFVGLSVVHQRTAFPLFWILLPKKGNSHTKERIQLMNQLLSVFGTQHILYLTGDREFIGKQWFDFLIENQIPFRLRIKKNMMISRSTGQLAPAQQFFRSLPLSTECQLVARRWVCGHRLWVTGMRLPSGDYLIVVAHDDSDQVMHDYSKRWKLEVFFQSLKSRGFNFEDVNLKDRESLWKLLAVITIAFCWAYHVGAWLNEIKPIRIKNPNAQRRACCAMVLTGFAISYSTLKTNRRS